MAIAPRLLFTYVPPCGGGCPAFGITTLPTVRKNIAHLRGWKYRWFKASSAERRQGGSNTSSPSRRAIDASDADGRRSAYGTCNAIRHVCTARGSTS